MFVSPIIERELRMALRRHNPVRSRMVVTAIASGLSFLFLLFGLVTRTWGSDLLLYLFLGSLYAAVLRPTHIALGIISEERRNQTLELLFLTGMTSFELFIGKVFGTTLVASCELLAVAPFLAIPFISGGLSMELYLATIVCLPTILLFIISVCVLASVLCNDDTIALMTTVALVAIISCATPVPFYLGKTLSGQAPFSADWLCLSPGYGALTVGSQFALGSPVDFWPTAVCTVLWTILCFSLAAAILARTWRDDADAGILRSWRIKWQNFLRGTETWRTDLRSVVLTKNPYEWLARHDRRPVLAAGGIILFICLLWLTGWLLWPRHWPSTMNFLITAMLLLITLNTVISHTAARRIGSDRRDGLLELLLTTPLSPMEIVEGQIAAIREQFKPVRRGLTVLFVLMMLGGFFTRSWNNTAIATYLMVWTVLIFWCTSERTGKISYIMWIAVNTGRPTFAALRAGGGIGSWFWILFQLQNLRSFSLSGGPRTFPTGTVAECVIVGFVAFVFLIITVAMRNDRSDMTFEFTRQLRSIAQEPVPDLHDPRYKKWKHLYERFPSAEKKPTLEDLLKRPV